MRVRQFYKILLMECSNIMAGNTSSSSVPYKAAKNEVEPANPPMMEPDEDYFTILQRQMSTNRLLRSHAEDQRLNAAEQRAYVEEQRSLAEHQMAFTKAARSPPENPLHNVNPENEAQQQNPIEEMGYLYESESEWRRAEMEEEERYQKAIDDQEEEWRKDTFRRIWHPIVSYIFKFFLFSYGF